MKVTINVAKKYDDLSQNVIDLGLIEGNRSPQDVKDYFDKLLASGEDIEITTLHDEIINIVGQYIGYGRINSNDVIINIYRYCDLAETASYDKDGYLDYGWPFGLLTYS